MASCSKACPLDHLIKDPLPFKEMRCLKVNCRSVWRWGTVAVLTFLTETFKHGLNYIAGSNAQALRRFSAEREAQPILNVITLPTSQCLAGPKWILPHHGSV